ncbi:hypothetical protein F5B22DRAFT_587647 [Xylaria bambusicola]|uniref:uncharacterized protein n=1 Tax=Xylaria bambusicola TaxID=326684 RepID=UPI002007495E|nr:uncharacterized protein F5B22DRAFT_587647 [Xylaria bambusicola]KAI0525764.1 hypothetical protein F5B22DRAFT_587647 [Xylaria bambusicola]
MAMDEPTIVRSDEDHTLGHRKILILYGSETGNSEESAGDIERLARRLHFQTVLEEMDDVELSDLLQYPFVVFVVSTTGQGELPKNARKFWKSLLRKRLPPNCLRQLNFTTFGLGDSSYFQYNWAARKLHKRLEQLGAVECLPRGEADERHEDGIDGTFLAWCLTLRTYLEKVFPLPLGLSPIPLDVQLTPKFTIRLVEEDRVTDSEYEKMPRSKIEIDNHGRILDREAAIYSHVDHLPRLNTLRYEHEVEGRMPEQHIMARVSNKTATNWPGGVDILDRPNVLRDIPTKYSLDDSTTSLDESPPTAILPIPRSWEAMVTANDRLTPGSHWQDVRHVVLRVSERLDEDDCSGKICDYDIDRDTGRLVYRPGDVAVIYPKNFTQDVQTLIDIMDWGDFADRTFEHIPESDDIPRKKPRHCFPLKHSTLRDLLTHNYDITCIPRRTFFMEIAHYTEDTTHKERLREFADPRHSDEFWDYTSRPRRSILEVLQDFPSVRIPYQHIPSVFPVIRGREYSIASGGYLMNDYRHHDDTVIDLAVALVKYKTVLRKTRQGLCSRYIASLKPGTKINIKIISHKVPSIILNPLTPLLAIAPGTGIAPIRALLHHRAAIIKKHQVEDTTRDILFYGGRNRSADFLFESDWKKLDTNVFTAFSRDQTSKIYVQDRLLENYKQVCEWLAKGCAICLCGSSGKMPEAVRVALYDCMVKGELATDREDAKSKFHKTFVFWEEVW